MNIDIYRIDNEIKSPLFSFDDLVVNELLDLIAATYTGKLKHVVKNFGNEQNCEKLRKFLKYIISYPLNIKTPEIKTISCNRLLDKNTNKKDFDCSDRSIVLFSGGIDSTAALLHFRERGEKFAALWCDYGQPYNQEERKAVYSISSKLNITLYEVNIDLQDLLLLGKNTFKHIIPARNLLLSAIAAVMNPKQIILAGLADELHVPDKSIRMYQEAPEYLHCKLYSPFTNMTKVDILCVWKSRWENILSIDDTVSCYASGGNCQNCSACAKREVAKVVARLTRELPRVFINLSHYIENHWFSRITNFETVRRCDLLIAFDMLSDSLPARIVKLTTKYSQIYQNEIIERKINIARIKNVF